MEGNGFDFVPNRGNKMDWMYMGLTSIKCLLFWINYTTEKYTINS